MQLQDTARHASGPLANGSWFAPGEVFCAKCGHAMEVVHRDGRCAFCPCVPGLEPRVTVFSEVIWVVGGGP